MFSKLPSFWVIGGACANSRYQAHLQCGLESRLILDAQNIANFAKMTVQPVSLSFSQFKVQTGGRTMGGEAVDVK